MTDPFQLLRHEATCIANKLSADQIRGRISYEEYLRYLAELNQCFLNAQETIHEYRRLFPARR